MPGTVPKGWVKTKLGEVCLPVPSIHPTDSPHADFTYFDIGGIDNERNRITEPRTVTGQNAPSRARLAVQKDDILFSTVRTYLRKIARVEQDYPNPVASTGFTVIRAPQGVSSEFLFYQVLSDTFLQPLHELQTGTSYPAVRDRDVLSQPILLAPTHEQERIAAKLNAALSSVRRAETAARRAQERLRRYRVSVLDAAVTGTLTRSWRESKAGATRTETGEDMLRRLLVDRRILWEETELKRLRDSGKIPKDDKWQAG
jgi:type I restriction enzyme, S subunit